MELRLYGLDELNPPNIETVYEYIPEDVQFAKLRVTTTGHGQGNTENAAEFSYKFMISLLMTKRFFT